MTSQPLCMTFWPELYKDKQWNSFDKSQADFQLWSDMQEKTNTLIIPIILNGLFVWLFVDFVLPWVRFIGVVLLRWGFGTIVVPILQYVKQICLPSGFSNSKGHWTCSYRTQNGPQNIFSHVISFIAGMVGWSVTAQLWIDLTIDSIP